MTPNASIAGSLTPSSLAAGSTNTIGASTKATGGQSDPFSSSQQGSTGSSNSANKQGSKKNSNSTANSGQASTVGGSSLQGNKKVFLHRFSRAIRLYFMPFIENNHVFHFFCHLELRQ